MSESEASLGLIRRRRRIARVVAVVFFPVLIGLVVVGATASRWYGNAPAEVSRGSIAQGAASDTPAAPGTQVEAPPSVGAPASVAPVAPTSVAPASVAPAVAPAAVVAPATEAPRPRIDEFDFPAGFVTSATRPQALEPEARVAFLARVAACSGRIEVLGHTDSVGEEQTNLLLGMRRADYVRNLLIREGVDPGRLFTGSVGDREPPLGETAPEAAARLRRVSIRCERVALDAPVENP
jgi:outer membrane protein OmpA-like peptidoglycan-associated protein